MPEITNTTIIIVIAACGVVGLSVILTVICAFCCCRREKKEASFEAIAGQPATTEAVRHRATELGALEQPPQEMTAVGPPSPKPTASPPSAPLGGVAHAPSSPTAQSYSASHIDPLGGGGGPPRLAGHPLAVEEAAGPDVLRSGSVVVNSVGSTIDV